MAWVAWSATAGDRTAASFKKPTTADRCLNVTAVLPLSLHDSRAPGKPFQWDRLRSLFLPGARMIPNTEQTGGAFTTHTVDSFITWIDESWKRVGIGSPNDRGFAESHVAGVTEQYGDIAHVMSTYEKHRWGETQVLVGRLRVPQTRSLVAVTPRDDITFGFGTLRASRRARMTPTPTPTHSN